MWQPQCTPSPLHVRNRAEQGNGGTGRRAGTGLRITRQEALVTCQEEERIAGCRLHMPPAGLIVAQRQQNLQRQASRRALSAVTCLLTWLCLPAGQQLSHPACQPGSQAGRQAGRAGRTGRQDRQVRAKPAGPAHLGAAALVQQRGAGRGKEVLHELAVSLVIFVLPCSTDRGTDIGKHRTAIQADQQAERQKRPSKAGGGHRHPRPPLQYACGTVGMKSSTQLQAISRQRRKSPS